MHLIDTHAHLNFRAFASDLPEVVERSQLAGISNIIVVGTNLENSLLAVELAGQFPIISAVVGIHPYHVYHYFQMGDIGQQKLEEDLREIDKLAIKAGVVAIGETGLDKYLYKSTSYQNYQVSSQLIEFQKFALRCQLHIAHENDLPVVIHNRGAAEELITFLSNFSGILPDSAVFHCSEPNVKLLEFALKKNYFLGVAADATYSSEKQQFISSVPLDNLVVETDAPFFVPVNVHTSRAEPVHIIETAKKVAEIKEMSLNELALKTTENARLLFPLMQENSKRVVLDNKFLLHSEIYIKNTI